MVLETLFFKNVQYSHAWFLERHKICIAINIKLNSQKSNPSAYRYSRK